MTVLEKKLARALQAVVYNHTIVYEIGWKDSRGYIEFAEAWEAIDNGRDLLCELDVQILQKG